MDATVYFLPTTDKEDDSTVTKRLKQAIRRLDLFSFIEARDMVAVKTHFGEKNSSGYVRPLVLKMMAEQIKQHQALPFLTETATLYRGQRSNAVDHLRLAHEHGFTLEKTGMPIIMADGLLGDEEIEIPTGGQLYDSVRIATLIAKAHALVAVSHFTGHLATGFGATLKNLGMGCASRRGKLIQHSTAKPDIRPGKCTGCRECQEWCPQDAIFFEEGTAVIDEARCIGCAECLAVCRYDAVGYNWSETYENLQKKVAEHALGVRKCHPSKAIYFNFLQRITKDCDCMSRFERIMPDVGVLMSFDPVAVDAAALDLVEDRLGAPLPRHAYDIPYRAQLEHAVAIGAGQTAYRLEEV